jgi:hypothetical protein
MKPMLTRKNIRDGVKITLDPSTNAIFLENWVKMLINEIDNHDEEINHIIENYTLEMQVIKLLELYHK